MLGLKILAHIYLFFTRVYLHIKQCGTLKVFVWGSQTMLTWLFKNASFGPIQIYTGVFQMWKSTDLDSAWVRYSFSCQFPFLPRVFPRLAMWHTRVLGVGISNYAYLNFQRC